MYTRTRIKTFVVWYRQERIQYRTNENSSNLLRVEDVEGNRPAGAAETF